MPTSPSPSPYRIVRLLGRGGMAQVFEAVSAGAGGFERRVAIKQILADHHADGSVLRSFFDEARLAGSLHHGGIVGVLDYGVAEGTPFQVLELVDGSDARSLAEAGRRLGRPLPPLLALHLCREVAHALHYAHESVDAEGRRLGIVHRDVKPANVLVSWSGDVKLGDFGVAFASVRSEQTEQGVAKGTPAYMAPEQSRGDVVDPRADVFSLGCVLHALLSGKSPMSSQDTYLKVLLGADPPLDADLPADARAIVEEATRADRRERYATAALMAEALGEAAARRGERDVKTELIAWLGSIRAEREPAPAPRPGRLDALLGAELMLSGDEAREGTLRRPPPEPLPEPTEAVGAPLRADPTLRLPLPARAEVSSPPRRARGPAMALALLGMLALGCLLALALLHGSSRPALDRTAAPGLEHADPLAPVPLAEASVATTAPSSAAPVPPTTVLPKVAPKPRPTDAPRPAPAPTPAPSLAPSTGAVAPPAAPEMLATLAIGGPVGAAVLIDGAPRGLTPKYLQLPPGTHRIQLVGADGAPLGSGVVKLRADHTASSPLRWSP